MCSAIMSRNIWHKLGGGGYMQMRTTSKKNIYIYYVTLYIIMFQAMTSN